MCAHCKIVIFNTCTYDKKNIFWQGMGWAKIYIQSPGVTLIVLLFIAKKYLLGFFQLYV